MSSVGHSPAGPIPKDLEWVGLRSMRAVPSPALRNRQSAPSCGDGASGNHDGMSEPSSTHVSLSLKSWIPSQQHRVGLPLGCAELSCAEPPAPPTPQHTQVQTGRGQQQTQGWSLAFLFLLGTGTRKSWLLCEVTPELKEK